MAAWPKSGSCPCLRLLESELTMNAYEYPLAGDEDPLSRAQVLEEIPSTVPLVRNHVRLHQVPGVHLTESEYPALFNTPLHLHTCATLYLVLQGSVREHCGNISTDHRSGDLIYFPPDEPHREKLQGSKGVLIEVVPELVKQSVGWDSLPRYSTGLGAPGFVLASRMLAELRYADQYSPSVIQALAVELLVALCRTKKSKASTPPWVKRVTEYLTTAGVQPSLRDLAKEVGVHPVSVARAFRRHYGCTIGE
jgi:AraC family transcriptional regulator